jgi:hypothetical protein
LHATTANTLLADKAPRAIAGLKALEAPDDSWLWLGSRVAIQLFAQETEAIEAQGILGVATTVGAQASVAIVTARPAEADLTACRRAEEAGCAVRVHLTGAGTARESASIQRTGGSDWAIGVDEAPARESERFTGLKLAALPFGVSAASCILRAERRHAT